MSTLADPLYTMVKESSFNGKKIKKNKIKQIKKSKSFIEFFSAIFESISNGYAIGGYSKYGITRRLSP